MLVGSNGEAGQFKGGSYQKNHIQFCWGAVLEQTYDWRGCGLSVPLELPLM